MTIIAARIPSRAGDSGNDRVVSTHNPVMPSNKAMAVCDSASAQVPSARIMKSTARTVPAVMTPAGTQNISERRRNPG